MKSLSMILTIVFAMQIACKPVNPDSSLEEEKYPVKNVTLYKLKKEIPGFDEKKLDLTASSEKTAFNKKVGEGKVTQVMKWNGYVFVVLEGNVNKTPQKFYGWFCTNNCGFTKTYDAKIKKNTYWKLEGFTQDTIFTNIQDYQQKT